MVGLAVLLVMVGVTIVFGTVIKVVTRRSVTDAERRMDEIVRQAAEYNPQFAADQAQQKAKPARRGLRGRRANQPQLVDQVATRLENSKLFRDPEGQQALTRFEMYLKQAGIYEEWPPHRALALALLVWANGLIIPLALCFFLDMPMWFGVLLAIAIIPFPLLKLRSLRNARQERIKAEVPTVIASLAMAMSGSMVSINDAIRSVAARAKSQGNESPLLSELSQAEAEYASNATTLEEALRGVSERSGVQAVDNLVEALVQAITDGAALGPILTEYADVAAVMWEQDMETMMAKKAPVRTIGMVITMWGAVIAIATPLIINLIRTLSGF